MLDEMDVFILLHIPLAFIPSLFSQASTRVRSADEESIMNPLIYILLSVTWAPSIHVRARVALSCMKVESASVSVILSGKNLYVYIVEAVY